MIVEKMVATDGHVLTNGEAYGKVIYLGCDDAAENWREITEEEYERIMRADERDLENVRSKEDEA